MRRRLAAVGLTMAVAAGTAPAAGAAPPRREPAIPTATAVGDLLDQARRSAVGLSFTGRVLVRWVDDDGLHGDAVDVEASEGVLVVEGAEPRTARGPERLVQSVTGDWDLLWPAGLADDQAPALSGKYELTRRPGPTIAGRLSTVVEIRRNDRLVERLFLDQTTSLVLRREQPDGRGGVRRSVAFDELAIDVVPVPLTGPVVPARPRPARANALRPPYQAPATVGDGYRRMGTYRRDDVVQVVYSDGMYGLSVFQQAGRLDRAAVPPGGRRVEVAGLRGWSWSWAGGEILLWEAEGMVVTMVGDAPLPDVLAAARSLPAEAPRSSLIDKLRSATGLLLGLGH